MLVLAVVSLVFPALFKYSHPEPSARMDELHLSEAVASVLSSPILVASLHAQDPRAPLRRRAAPARGRALGRCKAIVVLALATVGVAVSPRSWCTPRKRDADLGLSQTFLGLIIIPIIGNAAEHATAVMVARKGQMDLSLQIALGSSTQVALLVAPLLVFIGLVFGQPMNLVFQPFEVAILWPRHSGDVDRDAGRRVALVRRGAVARSVCHGRGRGILHLGRQQVGGGGGGWFDSPHSLRKLLSITSLRGR